jgi:hypothetical protein
VPHRAEAAPPARNRGRSHQLAALSPAKQTVKMSARQPLTPRTAAHMQLAQPSSKTPRLIGNGSIGGSERDHATPTDQQPQRIQVGTSLTAEPLAPHATRQPPPKSSANTDSIWREIRRFLWLLVEVRNRHSVDVRRDNSVYGSLAWLGVWLKITKVRCLANCELPRVPGSGDGSLTGLAAPGLPVWAGAFFLLLLLPDELGHGI